MAGAFSVVTGDPLFHHGLTTSLRLLGVRSPGAAEMRSEIPYSLHWFTGQFAGKTTVFHGTKNIKHGFL